MYRGGAANANNVFGGGEFKPPQDTNTPEGSSGITKVLFLPNPTQYPVVLAAHLIDAFVGSPYAQTRGAQTLVPLTVKQIMDASQTNDDRSSFAVNGTEVSTVLIFASSSGVYCCQNRFLQQ